jgi:lysozyme family protein
MAVNQPSDRALYCIGVMIGFEGGLVNNPSDPGGVTKYGISKRSYPSLDIPNLTVDQAQAIYFRDYWTTLQCDRLPKPLDLYVLDAGILQGIHAAVSMLQTRARVNVDGIMGTGTISAARAVPPNAYLAERALRYLQSPPLQLQKFGIGWLTRLFSIVSR